MRLKKFSSFPLIEKFIRLSQLRGLSGLVRVGHLFFSKECNVLAFFSVLYKRKWLSLHSFPFFIKEHGVL